MKCKLSYLLTNFQFSMILSAKWCAVLALVLVCLKHVEPRSQHELTKEEHVREVEEDREKRIAPAVLAVMASAALALGKRDPSRI